MISVLCITFPCIISILFVVLFSLRKNKNVTDKIFLGLALCAVIYFFAEVNYICLYEDYKTWIFADIASQYARPLIPPLMVLCIHSLTGRLVWRWWMTIAFALAIMIGSVSMCVYILMGIDNAAEYVNILDDNDGEIIGHGGRVYWLHHIFCVWLYRTTNIVYASIGIGRIVYLIRSTGFKWKEVQNFLMRGGEIEPAFLVSILYLVTLGSIFMKFLCSKYFFIDHQVCASIWCVMRGVLVFLIGHVGLRCKEATVTLERLRVTTIDGISESRNCGISEMRKEGKETEADTSETEAVGDEWEKMMSDGLERLERERLYLDAKLSIEGAAGRIGTNRTYLSRYIGERHGCTFREYIGRLRVEYAKEYMIRHKDAKQEVVAEECGFVDAPSFNKKFKAMVGMSPRMWVMFNDGDSEIRK